jgi:hypothetical protein
VASGEWFFWRARLCRAEKISVVLEHDPPVKAKTIANGERRVASSEWFFWRARLCRAEKIFGLAGTKLEGCSPEQPNLFSVVQEHDPPVKAKNWQRLANSEWRTASSE